MAQRLRIATFNLEDLGGRSEDDRSLSRRIGALRPQLDRLTADVLCLQEVNAQDLPGHRDRALISLDRILEGTAYADFHRTVTLGTGGQHFADKHNLVTLSRWPITASERIRHDLLPPLTYAPVTSGHAAGERLELQFDRALLHARVELPDGRTAHVVNLHLKAPLALPIPGQKMSAFRWKTIPGWAEGFFLAGLKRAGQALEARLLVDRLFDSDADALIAVCGDFNAEGREVPLRILLGDPDDTGNMALSGRALAALDDLVLPDRRHSVIHAGRRVLLDHILVSPHLRDATESLSILNEGLADEATAGASNLHPDGSFHAPLVAQFKLPD